MEKIGKYQIIGELGVGGFGTVYKATDPSMGRVVAIKVLKAQDDAGMVKRFQAEARTAANLRHRNIVTVFEFGEENGMQFLVMEYLDGVTLRDLIVERAALSSVEKLYIMSEAALGLKAAHESGILHRDVKPANIMRLSDGSVKIMDFGISRPMEAIDTRLTQAGFLMGTPQYMAPEQFTSDSDADVLCDIWAYGVVLYEFLTLTNPFQASKPAQIIYRLTAEEPLPLSNFLSDVPERLETVVKRLLSKNRDRRYQTIEDARFDLQPVLLEMRQAQVQGLISAAEDLIRDRRLDEAQAMVRRVLDLDQSNAWARKWRGELRDMLRAQSVQLRVRQLLEKADAETAAGNEAAASENLKEALKLDPANDAVRKRIEEVRAARARAERAARLLESAREEMNRRALTRALEHASQAAESDPNSPEARKLVSEINQAMEQRDLEALRKNALNSATRLVLLQAYDEAITVLNQFAAQAPGDIVIQERLEEVKRLYAAHREQQRIERAVAESKELLRSGKYQQAIDVLRPCPQNTEIQQLLAYAAEQAEIEARAAQVRDILEQADARAQSGEIDRALDLAGQALELAPDNERAQQLRDSMLEARRRREEDREVERLAAKCRAGLSSGAIDDAGVMATELSTRFPGHPVVVALRQEVERRFEVRREALEREIREHQQHIEQLLKAGKSDEATVLLQSLTLRYPNQQQTFAPLLDRATKLEREKRERERELRQEAARAEQLLQDGRNDEATLILQSLTQRFPGKQQEFAPLFDRAAAIEREKREQRAIEAEVAEFRKIRAAGRWEEALAAIEKGLEQRPDQPEFVEERDRARRGMAAAKEKRDREAVQAELAQIRKISGAGFWEEALDEVEHRLANRPNQPEFLEERDSVRRGLAAARDQRERQAIETAAAAMRKLTTAGKWEEALAEIERGLAQHPNQPEFLEERALARQVMAAARGEREQQEVAAALAQIRRIAAGGQWEAALARLDECLAKRPNQPEFLEERDVARRGLAAARGQRERQEVESAIAQVRELSGAGKWEEALAKIEEFLAKRPNLPEFLEERDRARQGLAAARGQREQQEVKAAIAQIRQIGAAGNWEEALAKVEECIARRPNQPEFIEARDVARQGMATARAQRERQAIEEELAHIRQLGTEGRWEEALAEIELGLAKRPNQPQFAEERERARRRMACVQAVREIELSLSRGGFNQAIALAESAQRQYAEEPRIGVLLAAAREQRKLADDVGRLEGLLRKNEIDQANTLIAPLLRQHGADVRVQRMKQILDRLVARRQNFAAVEQLRKRLEFPKALELAGQLVKEDADDAAARDLFETLGREQADHGRAQRVAGARTEALRLLNTRKFDAAQQTLSGLAREFPDNGDIQDDLRRVQQARQEQEKKDGYARGRAEAEALVKQRRMDDAIAKLETLLKSFPEDPFLLQDLKAAQDTKALRDRSATVEAEIRALEALFDKGDAQGVKDRASRFLEKYEEPRARELLNWATKTLSEVRGIRRKIDGTLRRALWIGGIAAALALAVIFYLKSRTGSTDVTELGVQPAELTFTYQRGGTAPKPGILEVKGKPATQVWTVATTDPWFTVRPAELTGNGAVQVEVDPTRLAPGEYSGFATVSAKDASVSPASIRIRMRVMPEPAQEAETKKEEPSPIPTKKSGTEVKKAEEKKQEVVLPPPPPPKKAEEKKQDVVTATPPPVDPPVDCKAADYLGLSSDTIDWTGTLAGGESVTIARRNKTTGGATTRIRGSALPGCEVSVGVVRGGVKITEMPTVGNRFSQVIVTNPGTAPIGNFAIRWSVKK